MSIRDDLSEWLARALDDGQGKEKLTMVALAETAGVSRASLYRIVQRKGLPEQETINQIAKALGVAAPQIDVRLVESPVPEAPAASALSLVREAARVLEKAQLRLEEEERAAAGEPTGEVASSPLPAAPVAGREKLKQAAAAASSRPGKGKSPKHQARG